MPARAAVDAPDAPPPTPPDGGVAVLPASGNPSLDHAPGGGVGRGPLGALLAHGAHLADDLQLADVVTVSPALRAFAIALLSAHAPLLVVLPRSRDADHLAQDVGAFLGDEQVAVFPAWETLPHERLSPQAATVGARLEVLDGLRRDALRVVFAPVRAALQPMDPRLATREPLSLDARWSGGLDGLVTALAALGYTRTPLVSHRGEMAVRGGIVDVFPSSADHPVRVEFFGDDVDTVRAFAAADQRTLEALDSVTVHAARELVLDEETAGTARALAGKVPVLARHLGQLAEGIAFDGAEALVTAIHPTPAYLPDFLPADARLVVLDAPRVELTAEQLRDEASQLLVAGWLSGSDGSAGERVDEAALDLLFGGAGSPSERSGFADWEQVARRVRGGTVELTPFASDATDVTLRGRGWESFRGDVAAAAAAVKLRAALDAPTVLTTLGTGPAHRLAEVLRGEELAPRVLERVPDGLDRGVVIVPSGLAEGFSSEDLGLAVLGEHDLFGPRRHGRGRRLPTRRAAGATVLDLAPGDPVVHVTHGIGRYEGIVTRELRGPVTAGGGTTGTVTKDYVVLQYAGGDKLFVPSDAVDAISRYVGGEAPRVMRMGGAEWERARGKVRAHVAALAGELIRLYQARMHAAGHAFAPDGEWQTELEQAFPHSETGDQLAAIDEVKQDMEAPLPMDRLIAGDVGFGKTEIAVRAAAKAVFDGKQVAVLVPTTLLAQQHGETFTERFAGFPVSVHVLSRFASLREQKATLDGLAAGTVDLVVGTHRLLSADVTFKDLGLVVVDEEHRFGVGHKERLKQLRTAVDVLTMSATPIPRTLEMAITGIRDLSTIETPPEERQPVVTHVGEWDAAQAALAVRRELLREGQVFWVHNQVQTIAAATEQVQQLVPNARVRCGHGQMPEGQLEQLMLDFWHREFDVLVSTTIIESGLDIPNANTLVIERAELLGLAQLHQIRGRVGRSAARGYAYLFHPDHRSLSEEAYKRLEGIASHTALGSGMGIALADLEIRGAGSLLGADQSGHVAAVGFEAYSRLMAEAVVELTQGTPAAPEPEISVDLPVDAHLPKDWLGDEALRLEAYRKIAAIRDAAGVKAVRAELVDRYGALPPPAERLLSAAALKAALRRWGITDVATTPRRTARLQPLRLTDSQQVRLERTHRGARYAHDGGVLELPLPAAGTDLVAWLAQTLAALLGR